MRELSNILTNVTVCGLSRAVYKDIETAAEALKTARRPRLSTRVLAPPIRISGPNSTPPAKKSSNAPLNVSNGLNFVDDVEFYAEDAGRTDNEYLRTWWNRDSAGATVVNIPRYHRLLPSPINTAKKSLI